MKPKPSSPIAIVGMACMFPQASDLQRYWSNIKNGVDAITDVPDTHWNTADYLSDGPQPDMSYAARGGFLPTVDFDPLAFGISPNALEATDTTQLLGLIVAKRALEDAGYKGEREPDRDRTSVILGVTGTLPLVIPLGARLGHPIWRKALADAGVEGEVAEDVVARISDAYVPWQEQSFPGLLGNVVAGRIANRLDLHGTNCVVDAACASSLSAIHLAVLELAAGRSDVVVSGGLDTFNDIFMYMCFSQTPALSPTGEARPFDASGDGTILGEGLGVVVLKRLEDAEADGDRVYAVIKGVGSSSDGKGNAIYAPSTVGQRRALEAAYRAADVTPDTIELVEAHGTGTKVGDSTEAKALTSVYRETRRDGTWCALGSVKSQIGHTKAAAGVAGIIKAALSLHHKVLPPTIKVEQPVDAVQPGATPFYVNTSARPWVASDHPRRAAVSAFGFGGSNFHVVLEETEERADGPDWDGDVQIIAMCAADTDALARKLDTWRQPMESWSALRSAAAASRMSFRHDAAVRLTLVVTRGAAPVEKVADAAADMLKRDHAHAWTIPQGASFGLGQRNGSRVAWLFPGQGAQYPGMLRDLAMAFPEMQSVLTEADASFRADSSGKRLVDFIYPHPAFDDAGKSRQFDALRATEVAQPAIGAVSLGALRVLESFGVRAHYAAGHSFGELTALCAAARLEPSDFHALSRLRGQLMAGNATDRGTMLAVSSDASQLTRLLRSHGLDLVIANRNAPEQNVLSGSVPEIDRAEEVLRSEGIRTTRLPVSAAFHSRLVADAQHPFAEALSQTLFHDGDMPVYSNTTGAEYPTDAEDAIELLAGQLAHPVQFVQLVQNLRRNAVDVFVEVGPGARLTSLVNRIDSDAHAIAIDTSKENGLADLARALSRLAALAVPVQLEKWDAGFQETTEPKPALTVPLSGANYVSTREARPKRAPTVAPTPAVAPTPTVAPTLTAPTQTVHTTATASDGVAALQEIQTQTAELHRLFLEGQAQMQHALAVMLQTGATMPVAAPARDAAPIRDAAPAPEPASAPEPPRPEPATVPAHKPNTNVAQILLDIVAEKTGYPTEVLALDMDLDADLGIDSIKRVEILSALTERVPDLPPVKPEHLGTLHTLGEIVAFLDAEGRRPSPSEIVPRTPDMPAAASSVADVLLAVVSEKTGYPAEVLELDMDLDADLGIDSIKRVEILSALQERVPDLPEVKPEHLGTLHTLGEIVAFLDAGSSRPPAPAPSPAPSPAASAPAAAPSTAVAPILLAVVADKTGYPVDVLELDMDLDSDLGIDSIKRVEILSALTERVPDLPEVKPEHLGTLHTLGEIVAFLENGSTSVVASAPTAAPATPTPPRPAVHDVLHAQVPTLAPITGQRPAFELTEGEIWITDNGTERPHEIAYQLEQRGVVPRVVNVAERASLPERLAGLILLAPPTPTEDDLLDALRLLRDAADALSSASVLIVSQLDGAFGLRGLDGATPIAGGYAGLAKTAAAEWPGANVKALDAATGAPAAVLADELFVRGPVEVGVTHAGLSRVILEDVEVSLATSAPALGPNDVVVITGGARGVTADVANALAAAGRPTLVLLGRSEMPHPEPDWLAPLRSDADIKRALFARKSSTPREVAAQTDRILRNREMRRNIARLQSAGSTVVYRSVDVRNPVAVRVVLDDVRRDHGPITGLVHGAGVLADRLIRDKTDDDFRLVYGTKIGGLEALLQATRSDELRVVVFFSSSTARFGRKGQADYAMANEVLNKTAQSLRRSGLRVLSLNWGPWDGGMVTPGLRSLFESEGIGLIDPNAGGRWVTRALGTDSLGPEVVVMAARPVESGPVVHIPAPPPEPAPARHDEVLPAAFDRNLRLETHPFLESHVLGGRPVLPLAMIVEWLTHGALHENPGLTFTGFDQLRVFNGVSLDRGQPYRIRVLAGTAQRKDDMFIVPVELWNAGSNGDALRHARATVRLAPSPPSAPALQRLGALEPFPVGGPEIYQKILFHGPRLQGLSQLGGVSDEGISAVVPPATPPGHWMKAPLRSRWLADPLALDSAFQLMILWTWSRMQQVGLPMFAESYRQFAPFEGRDVEVHVRVRERGESSMRADIDFADTDGTLVARMLGCEVIVDPSLTDAFRRNRIEHGSSMAASGAR